MMMLFDGLAVIVAHKAIHSVAPPGDAMPTDQSTLGAQTDHCVDEERQGAAAGGAPQPGDPTADNQILKLTSLIATETVHVGDSDHRTRLVERIGGGSFGEIYLGVRLDNQQKVAVKVELQNSIVQYLLNEGNVYRKLEGVPGIPRVHWYGLHGLEYAMMVMELLGETLYELWVECTNKFTMKTMLMIIDQMIGVVQHAHVNNIVHRDISVSNFMVGTGKLRNRLHLIDFGHAKKLAPGTVFLPGRKRVVQPQPMVGTPRFASVFCHMGQESGYRDDMESLGYIWIYLLKGRLPWQGQRLCLGESKLDRIAYLKLNTRLETLCEGLPEEFLVYMNYVRRLRPKDMPDHEQLRELFRNLGSALNQQYDWKFDWLENEPKVDDKLGSNGIKSVTAHTV